MTQGHSCYMQGTCPAQGAGRTRGPEPVGGALPLEAPAMSAGLPRSGEPAAQVYTRLPEAVVKAAMQASPDTPV